ncbi:MAG: DedA family protein [Chloroflexi bacterium]|nr:DedA family protein [Chloroflexota bacterium]
MLDQIEATILSALQTIFDQFGWVGVFGLMVLENATGVTPNELILTFAGWMLIERHGIAPGFILVGGLYAGFGSAVGASIVYWVARNGGRPMIERFAKFFRIDLSLLSRAEDQMQKWGAWIIFAGRVLPGIRMLVSIPAGLARIPFPKFFFATFLGAYIWCTLFIGAGYLLGHEWMLISDYIKKHIPLVMSLVVVAGGLYLAWHFRKRIPALAWIKTKKLDNNES